MPEVSAELHGFAADQVLAVHFTEINAKGHPMVMLENLTGRGIETIRGSFRLHDADGNLLHSTGLTIAVPGQLFVAAHGQTESSPYGLANKADLMEHLAESPDDLVFSFEVQDVQFLEAK